MDHHDQDENRRHYEIQPYVHREMPLSTYLRHADTRLEEGVHLRDYLNVILRRKWIVLSFLVSVVIITAIITLMTVPEYLSTVVVKIDKQNQNVLTFRGVGADPEGDYRATQLEILKSRSLAERVVKRLNLAENDNFLPVQGELSRIKVLVMGSVEKFVSSFFSLFSSEDDKRAPGAIPRDGTGAGEEEVPPYLSNALISRLEVEPVKNSQLVYIQFSANDPVTSMTVANTIASEYIEYDLDSRVDAGKKAKEFLQQQIDLTRTKVEESEQKLNDYASRNSVIYIDGDKRSVMTQKLSEITSGLSAVTTERLQKEALYRQIKESGTDNPVILNDPLIQSLKNEHARLEGEYYNLAKTFTPDYPKMKNLKSQIDSIHQRVQKEKNALISSVESDYRAAMKKEQSLRNTFATYERDVLDFQEKAVQYEILKREVDVNKEIYNSLLQRLNEVGVTAMSRATNIQIVDKALLPRAPFTPQKTKNLFLALMVGLMGGVGLAFVMEYFDNTIKDSEEIERNFHLPSLGMIPYQQSLATGTPHLLENNAQNPVAEAFRSVGTFLLLSSATKPPKTILITSPGEKEGKSTVSLNIASALAETLDNGIIVDADMRKPRLHRYLNVDNGVGLSTCLSGNYNFDGTEGRLIKDTNIKGLKIITAGTTPPNPHELLHSARMKALLDSLHARFNFVIIDAPPLIGMPDSVMLSSMVDGTVMVVKAGDTPRDALSAAKHIFRSVNAKLLGVVLNGVKKQDLKYGFYSYYYSSYFKD